MVKEFKVKPLPSDAAERGGLIRYKVQDEVWLSCGHVVSSGESLYMTETPKGEVVVYCRKCFLERRG
ncbi:MAG: hypothetical protein GWN84_19975 [Gammaproteobacteria bacterium]|nr:hypothetical protein [Gammaproteobacteria bacterium]NIR85100.1 hypothetical protein [Gammaproteobacteria bacterium]NIR92010.1 hypothetical protein [Gammaproteobacteria bacterium]NIU06149.1 hypothetical protein [Gammaproteobacteria bacterium]NIV53092.1 hypothetical protein [Gammaproteobacteria bacterium]